LLAIRIERISPVKTALPYRAFVAAKEHQHARLIGLKAEEARHHKGDCTGEGNYEKNK
jgi:hypothetical protein